MPRSIWNGTVSVAALNVPVKLYSAVESKTVHFHEVHLVDGGRIEHRRFCSHEDREVPYDEVVKGFEVAQDEYVVLSNDEVKAAAGPRTRIIDVERFVDGAAIDPVFYARSYYLGARDGSEDSYRVLHDAMARTGRVAIGRFTFHNREYLVAIRPLDGVLALHTMRFADAVVAGSDLELDEPERAPSRREVEMAGQLISTLHEDFEPDRYRDEYRETVLGLIEQKARGEKLERPESEPADEAPDLMAALKASLEAGGGRAKSTRKNPSPNKNETRSRS